MDAKESPLPPRLKTVRWLLALAVASSLDLATGNAAEGPATRAVVTFSGAQLRQQRNVGDLFGLPILLRPFRAARLLGAGTGVEALRYVETPKGWECVAVAASGADAEKRLRGAFGAGLRQLVPERFLIAEPPGLTVALIGGRCVVEGAATAVDAVVASLNLNAAGDANVAKRLVGLDAPALGQRLAAVFGTPAPAVLYYFVSSSAAAGEGDSDGSATIVDIVRDLEHIWGAGIAVAVQPYTKALELLGRFRAARAEVWSTPEEIFGRVVLIAPSAAAAKRSDLAIQFGRQVGRMVAAGAARSGSMSQSSARLLDDILASIESSTDDDAVTLRLSAPASVLERPAEVRD